MERKKAIDESTTYVSKIPLTEANDDWLRAARLKREGNLEELEEMEATEMVAMDLGPEPEYEEDEEEE